MTIERTIADLVDDLKDLSLVADVLRDASGKRTLDLDRLGRCSLRSQCATAVARTTAMPCWIGS